MPIKEKIKNSLFLKIILIFLAAHLTIAAVGYSMHKYFASRPHHQNMDRNMAQYSAYLINRMGIPPDTSKAKELADSLHIAIRFTARKMNWASEPPDIEKGTLQWHTVTGKKQFSIAYVANGLFVQNTTPQGVYTLLFKSRVWENGSEIQWRILTMVLFMMFILTILYFIIRRLLQPIEQLDEATKQLSAGNLDYKLTTTRKDELGDLARSFNLMTARIKEMLKARDQLLLDASHELRSPLTRIKVALEFIENGSARNDIRSDIADMEMMITELLEKERLDSTFGGLHKTDVDLSEIVHKVCASYDKQRPGIELTVHAQNLKIKADGERLRMALDNLVQNALKFSTPDSPAVQINLEQSGQEVWITVQDFGQGIPSDEITHIFEPFYRVDKSRSKKTGGYGLGMSLVKKIIDLHSGKIEIDSEPGRGTTVRIRLKMNQYVGK